MGCGGSSQVTVGAALKTGHVVLKNLDTEIINNDCNFIQVSTSSDKIKYKLRGPPVMLCSKNVDARLIYEGNPSAQLYLYVINYRWYFYNDGMNCEMHVKYVFGPHSTITVCGKTMMSKGNEGLIATLTISPGDTEPFIEGIPSGFTSSFSYSPLSEVNKESLIETANKSKMDAFKAFQETIGKSEDPEEILSKCIANGVDYIDLQFMPGDASIFRREQDDEIECSSWLRPREFLPEKLHPFICLFNNINPCDIDQGTLGDRYLVCALSSLAEFPDTICCIFAHSSNNRHLSSEQKVNAFRVTLNKGGWWYSMILDAFLPSHDNVLKYAKNSQYPSDMWVSILEKAYAKTYGSYSAIIGGDPLQALGDLTGYPTTRIDNMIKKRDPNLFYSLKKWEGEGAIIIVSTPENDIYPYEGNVSINDSVSQSKYNSAGLALGHSYSLLRAVEVNGYYLVQIRNPWGDNIKWTGAWGVNDPRWKLNKEVCISCNFNGGDDGMFWMDINDMMSYFNGGGVCFIKPFWFDYRVKGTSIDGVTTVAMELNVSRNTEAFVSVHQQDRRSFRVSDPNREYSSIVITICRCENGKQFTHKHSDLNIEEPSCSPTFICGRDVSMRYMFESKYSPYYIIPRIYESNVNKDFVMSLVSVNRVGDGIDVKFKNLGATCPVFENFASFDNSTCISTETEYQYYDRVGAPKTAKGDCIKIER